MEQARPESSDEADGDDRGFDQGPAADEPGPDQGRPGIRLSVQETAERISALGGQLAILDGRALRVARPDGGASTVLDGDDPRGGSRASQPTWSNDGERLAWYSGGPAGRSVEVQEFDDEGVPDELVSAGIDGPDLFYLQWDEADTRLSSLRNAAIQPDAAPPAAPDDDSSEDGEDDSEDGADGDTDEDGEDEDGEEDAVPVPQQGGIEFAVIEPGGTLEPSGLGAPFYYSWAPTTDQAAAHVNGSEIRLYRPGGDGGAAEIVLGRVGNADGGGAGPGDGSPPPSPPGGAFSSPVWLDDDNLLIVDDGFLSVLPIGDQPNGDGRLDGQPLLAVAEPIRFVLSPDRSKVAFQSMSANAGTMTVADRFDPSAAQVGPNSRGLLVLDLGSNEIDLVAPDGAAAWEWSPDSNKLAWLAPASGSNRVRWNFWSDEANLIGTPATDAFVPTALTTSVYAPFFAQYSHSVTGWAPDSSAFAYPVSFGARREILIQLVEDLAVAFPVGPGDFVTWGTGPTPPIPAGGESPA